MAPRRDRFPDPGPELQPDQAPRLFELIRDVARATAQAVPRQVFLVSDVNAFVSERGGWMGFGSRRIMGLGLPLLQAFSVSELRAVLAHEFGHFHGGDTRLGPWIHKTRQAIERTVENLSQRGAFLHRPFQWYGRAFLRVSLAVSRQQEYAADRLAVEVEGRDPVAGGLVKAAAAAAAYRSYWSEELGPTLNAGFLPPIAGGFARFLNAPRISQWTGDIVERELREGESNPYDTHPCIRDRLAAISWSGAAAAAGTPEPRAVELLDDLPHWERKLVASLSDEDTAGRLESIDWSSVPERVLLPSWQAQAEQGATFLTGWTLSSLGERIRALQDGPGLLDAIAGERLAPEQRIAYARSLVGSGLCAALTRRGWAVDAPPGEPVALIREQSRLEPFALVPRLASDQPDEEAWREFCRANQIDQLDLGEALGLRAHALEPPAPPPEAAPIPAALARGYLWTLGIPGALLVTGLVGWAPYFPRYKVLDQTAMFGVALAGGLLFSWIWGERVVGLRARRTIGLIDKPRGLVTWFFLYAIAPLFLFASAIGFANGLGDGSPVVARRGPVVSTRVSRNQTAWYARVLHDGNPVELKVTRDEYERLRRGRSEVILETRAGRLGMEWLVRREIVP